MDYFLIILIILGIIFLAYRYIEYLRATRGTEGYAKRRVITLLFLAFMALIGISTVFADALFEFLGLDKPASFELMSFGAYLVLAIAAMVIMKTDSKPSSNGGTIQQNHSGSGDNVGRDKIVQTYPDKKKEKVREVTETLYQKLSDLNDAMLDLTVSFRNITGKDEDTVKDEEIKRVNNAAQLGQDFLKFYKQNKIHFDEETCNLIAQMYIPECLTPHYRRFDPLCG